MTPLTDYQASLARLLSENRTFDSYLYSASQRAFLDPREVNDAVPHFGPPGGMLPRVTDS